jgi:hypothetical protein
VAVLPETQDSNTTYDYNDMGFDINDPCSYKYQIKITDAEGKNTWISMYPLGSPQKIVYPSGDYEEYIYYNQPTAELQWPYLNFSGLLEKKAVWDANGDKQYIKYEYNGYGKVSRITYPGDGYLDYEYAYGTGQFGGGLVGQITDHRDVNDRPGAADGNTFTFEYYYLTGKIKSYTDCDGYAVNYDYSLAYGQPTEVNVFDPNGEKIYDVNYVYDKAGRLVDVCEPMLGIDQNLIAGFEYDDNGNRKKLHYYHEGTKEGSKTSIDYTYNKDNMLTGFNTTGGPAFTLGNVTVDGLGRLKSGNEYITRADQGTNYHEYYNEYDMRSQLMYAEITNIGGCYFFGDRYFYDKAGNVQQHIFTDNDTHTTLYNFTGDLMTQAGDTDLTWDKNGSLKLKDEAEDTALVYNWDNKLTLQRE